MIIRKTRTEDMRAIQQIYSDARAFMVQNGNPDQWGDEYPSLALLQEDIASERSYVCVINDKVVGVFLFEVSVDPTYIQIYEGEWLDDEPYGAVHRIASAVDTKGVATFCLEWCYKQHNNIRIDTHESNIPMQQLLKKLGYAYCGIIICSDETERLAYQKR